MRFVDIETVSSFIDNARELHKTAEAINCQVYATVIAQPAETVAAPVLECLRYDLK